MQVAIWSYSGSNMVDGMPAHSVSFGGYYWYLTATRWWVGVELPHGKALQAAEQSGGQKFHIQPGVEVALEIDSSVTNRHNEIRSKMEQMLKDNELVLKSEAPITLRLKVTQEKEVTTTYGVQRGFLPPIPRPMGMGFRGIGGGVEVKYTPQKFSIEFVRGGKVLWSQTKITSSPDSFPLDVIKDESLQGAVNEAMAKIDHADWFLGVKIPKRVPDAESIGRSTLGDNGIQDR